MTGKQVAFKDAKAGMWVEFDMLGSFYGNKPGHYSGSLASLGDEFDPLVKHLTAVAFDIHDIDSVLSIAMPDGHNITMFVEGHLTKGDPEVRDVMVYESKPIPKSDVEVPTEPGLYTDRCGRVWVNSDGAWYIVKALNGTWVKRTPLHYPNDDHHSVRTFGPFIRLDVKEHEIQLPTKPDLYRNHAGSTFLRTLDGKWLMLTAFGIVGSAQSVSNPMNEQEMKSHFKNGLEPVA